LIAAPRCRANSGHENLDQPLFGTGGENPLDNTKIDLNRLRLSGQVKYGVVSVKPKEINEFTEKALQIVWDNGEESIFFYDELREICPCATCRRLRKKSRTGKLPFKKRIPLGKSSMAPEKIEYVGNYAIRFIGENWCETGFYTFDFLRENSVPGE